MDLSGLHTYACSRDIYPAYTHMHASGRYTRPTHICMKPGDIPGLHTYACSREIYPEYTHTCRDITGGEGEGRETRQMWLGHTKLPRHGGEDWGIRCRCVCGVCVGGVGWGVLMGTLGHRWVGATWLMVLTTSLQLPHYDYSCHTMTTATAL